MNMQFHQLWGGHSFDVRRASNGSHTPANPERIEIHNHVTRTSIELKGAEATKFLEDLTHASDMEAVCRDAWFQHSRDTD